MDAQAEKFARSSKGVREALVRIRAITQKVAAGDNYYRLDRSDAAEYLWAYPKWRQQIRLYFDQLHTQGEQVIFADVCGRTNATSLGADLNYSFSLQPPEQRFIRSQSSVLVRGDIFSAKDFYSFVNLLRERGHRPAWVTFEPVAGLERHAPRFVQGRDMVHYRVTFQRLENNLRKMLEVVLPGGYVFLECPFQGMNLRDFLEGRCIEEYRSSLWVKAFCAKNECSVKCRALSS